MANKNFWLGILVMVLVFGLTVVGCDNDSTNGNDTYSGGMADMTQSEFNSYASAMGFSGITVDQLIDQDASSMVNTIISQFKPDERFSGVTESQLRSMLSVEGVPSHLIDTVINKLKTQGYVVAGMDLGGSQPVGVFVAKKD